MAKKLTLKQEKFVEYYVRLGIGVKAAQKAGYSPDNYGAAAVTAHHLLKDPKIKKAIKERKANLMYEIGLTEENLLKQMHQISLLAMAHKQHSAAVKATEYLGRELNLFTPKVQQEQTQTVYTLDMGKMDEPEEEEEVPEEAEEDEDLSPEEEFVRRHFDLD